jgi:drug/metabolite transporter (DMT)-like permease
MPLLLLVSFIWAFSFGLIGRRLAGVDTTAVATLRLALALLVFLPFFRRGNLRLGVALKLMLIGAIQFGAMYLFYQRSYLYLPSYAVALFVIPMPLYVTVVAAIYERQWHARYAIAALLAIAGAGAVSFQGELQRDFVHGFILMQLSNLCFAVGQIAWRQTRRQLDPQLKDATIFALPYIGAVATCVLGSFLVTDWTALHVSGTQWLVLVYLGAISSGACFFWWNLGALRVSAGTLAVMNNAKIPLAVACSLLFFGEKADLGRLAIAAVLMLLAVWVADPRKNPAPAG